MNAEIINTNEEKEEAESDLYIHTFKKPITYNGQEYKELAFDFGKLTGNDVISIEGEQRALGLFTPLPRFDSDYLTRMATKACESPIGHDIFETMPFKDFVKIKNAARRFLSDAE